MAENFDLIFGQNASQQYAWNDTDYQNGWETVGNIPPTAAQFDALQRRADTKAQELNSRLVNVEQAIAGGGSQKREPDTEYTVGTILTYDDLPMDWVLECIVGGISSANNITIPSPRVEGARILDGTVTWALRKIATYGGVGYRQSSTACPTGSIAFSTSLPTGWYLECTTGGTTSASDLVITSPSVGDTVTDGTVVWTIRKIGSGSGDGVPLGSILAYSANGNLPEGYLLCDGSAVSRTMFPDLFTAIGTTYGAGDGSTTFNLPDYNAAERFVQGSTVAGTVKSAGLPNITGGYKDGKKTATTAIMETDCTTGAFLSNNNANIALSSTISAYNNQSTLEFDASQSNPIYGASDTVQPPALTARFIIKAFDGQTPDSALIDITQYAQELATKADRDLDNLSATGEAKIASVSFAPRWDAAVSITAAELVAGYTAPANGFVYIVASFSDNQTLSINGTTIATYFYYNGYSRAINGVAVKQGDVTKVNSVPGGFNAAWFVPAN